MVLSNSMLIPVLPAIQKALGLTLFEVGIIITAFSIPAGLAIPVGGYLSDRWGRKVIIAPALIIFGIGGLIAGLAPLVVGKALQYPVILGGRILQGIGAGGTYQVAMALTGDIFQTKERSKALGLLEASNGAGKISSPIIGSATGLIQWFAPFFVYPLLALPSAASVWFVVPEPGTPGKPLQGQKRDRKEKSTGQSDTLASYISDLKSVFKKKGIPLLASFFAGFVVLFLLFGVLSWWSDILENTYGITGIIKGLVIALPVTGMAVTSYISGTVMQKQLARMSKLTVVAGMVLIGLSGVASFFSQGIYILTASIVLLGIGNGLVLPAINTLITSAAESKQRGIVTSLYGSVRFFGAALGPPAFGAALPLGKAVLFFGSAGLAGLSAAVAAFLIDQKLLLPKKLRGAADKPHAQQGTAAGKARTADTPQDEG
jgi:ACDE family multidrug resistance protein